MASGTIKTQTNPSINMAAQGVSVKVYSVTLKEGIHFYTTSSGTADNPTTGSYAYIIFCRSTGITILAMALGSRILYMDSSSTSGETWLGWKIVSAV